MAFSSVIKPAPPKVTTSKVPPMKDPITTKEDVKASGEGQSDPCHLQLPSTLALGKNDLVASTTKKDDKGCAGVQDKFHTLQNVNGNVKVSDGDSENLSSKPIKDHTAPPKARKLLHYAYAPEECHTIYIMYFISDFCLSRCNL
ncbi:uncharacterized protein LOC113213323 [Frankliniella occidentalis]|uniref:Uncharacterized protein LOC113213323 n=1 Tax=Frankliniella occidentalis TaxID=133901 RepID=A0A6J1T4A0_FRAOC|nr:uncharacterized protein LOC113213323 [Frankliniella occidentalis]